MHVLLTAALLVIGIGLAHSWLGERYILMRLFRQPLPTLFGSDRFTKATLRFAWHITTIAWFGFAALIFLMIEDGSGRSTILQVIGATFGISALTALVASRGRHFSWIVFTTIAVLCLLSAVAD